LSENKFKIIYFSDAFSRKQAFKMKEIQLIGTKQILNYPKKGDYFGKQHRKK